MPTTKQNIDTQIFPTATVSKPEITHIGRFTAQTGGTFRGSTPVTTLRGAVAANQPVTLPPGALRMVFPDGELEDTDSQLAADAVAGVDIWFSAHSGNPGNTGTNEITGDGFGRLQMLANEWEDR